MRRFFAAAALAALTAVAVAQPTIDGQLDSQYCTAIVVQDTQTNFGNSTSGTVSTAGGSEVDAAYAQIQGGTLYLMITGNLESNFNKLEIFFDTQTGGQNRLLAGASGTGTGDGINRMGATTGTNGLTFDADFEADYWISVTTGGGALYVDYADIPTAAGGTQSYLGTAAPGSDGTLSGGTNPNNIRVSLNNSNTGGVTGGTGLEFNGLADDVTTGVELAIPLAAIGTPAADFKVCAFINGQQHDYLANQVLAGIQATPAANLGEPRSVSFVNSPGNQYFIVPIVTMPCEACCMGTTCSIQPAASCATNGGVPQGAGSGCTPNPCVVAPSGSCCVGTSCSLQHEVDCANMFGEYLGDGTNCTANPCTTGACCLGTSCQVVREAVCSQSSGEYLGDGTNCDSSPCATGACCVGTSCQEVRSAVCASQSGLYFGNSTACSAGQCNPGACCFGTYCIQTIALVCTNQGGLNFGEGVSCTPARCNTPGGAIVLDGTLDAAYCNAQIVQNTQTQFGDANSGNQDSTNGSELDAAYAAIQGNRLYLFFAGNLESNFNKLDIFFDTRAGGQNRLNGLNPNVDFNGINNMGDDGSGNGLTFDTGFEADFFLSMGGGGTPYRSYVNYAELSDPADPVNNPGIGFYLGSGKASNASSSGLLDADPNAINNFAILAVINNSNTAGIGGGTAALDATGVMAAEAVMTGVEFSIPLSAIGNPASLGDIKICAMVNNGGHNFLSNQELGGIGGGENFGDPRLVNFNGMAPMWPLTGDQFFTLSDTCAASCVVGDANCDNVVNNFDIDSFVDIIVFHDLATPPASWTARGLDQACWDQRDCTGNINHDENGANNFDIDPFVVCIIAQQSPCP